MQRGKRMRLPPPEGRKSHAAVRVICDAAAVKEERGRLAEENAEGKKRREKDGEEKLPPLSFLGGGEGDLGRVQKRESLFAPGRW